MDSCSQQSPAASSVAPNGDLGRRKAHECVICHRTYDRRDHLSRHVKTHSAERSHVCSCDVTNRSRSHFAIHRSLDYSEMYFHVVVKPTGGQKTHFQGVQGILEYILTGLEEALI